MTDENLLATLEGDIETYVEEAGDEASRLAEGLARTRQLEAYFEEYDVDGLTNIFEEANVEPNLAHDEDDGKPPQFGVDILDILPNTHHHNWNTPLHIEYIDGKLYYRVEKYTVDEEGLVTVEIFYSNEESQYRYIVDEPELTPALKQVEETVEDRLEQRLKTTGTTAETTWQKRQEYSEGAEQIMEEKGIFAKTPIERLKLFLEFITEDELEKAQDERDDKVTEEDARKIVYHIQRDLAGYNKIDPLMSDPLLEEINCNGPHEPVYVNHKRYANADLKTNIEFDVEQELDALVNQLSSEAGKHISTSDPMVDAALPNGSRLQLTQGREVSHKGSNFTIRKFDEVPFTPVDLIRFGTFSVEQMAYFWLSLEHEKTVIFSGGTASGKTSSLNAVSMFMRPEKKIVSIEDTREITIPEQDALNSITREGFGADNRGEIDEFDLLEAALRQRPTYIIMGEVRGEEGRELMQAVNSGHAGYSTFHAETVSELTDRMTGEPISISAQQMRAIDIVSVQTLRRQEGEELRRTKEISEVEGSGDMSVEHGKVWDYNAANDDWDWLTDEEPIPLGSKVMDDIREERGWTSGELVEEFQNRVDVLTYLEEMTKQKDGFDRENYYYVTPIIRQYTRNEGDDNETRNEILESMRNGTLSANDVQWLERDDDAEFTITDVAVDGEDDYLNVTVTVKNTGQCGRAPVSLFIDRNIERVAGNEDIHETKSRFVDTDEEISVGFRISNLQKGRHYLNVEVRGEKAREVVETETDR